MHWVEYYRGAEMTAYETMTLAISITAIVASIGIPLTGYLYKKLRKPRLGIYEFEHQPLVIICTPTSSQIKLSFSILCQNAQCVIRSMKARIASEHFGESPEMRWTALESIHLNWANGMGNTINLNTMTPAHPLLLEADSLTPLSACFEPRNGMEPRFWRNGRYKITIALLYGTGNKFEQSLRFSLNAEEVERLRFGAAEAVGNAGPSSESRTGNPPISFIAKNFDEDTT